MSKEKQIDGIAKVICPSYGNKECYKSCTFSDCVAEIQAEDLYDAGYRKPEWISVKDWLPEKFTHVLCFYPNKDYGSNVVVDYMESDRGHFAYQFKYGEPTHWMPLPELPIENF